MPGGRKWFRQRQRGLGVLLPRLQLRRRVGCLAGHMPYIVRNLRRHESNASLPVDRPAPVGCLGYRTGESMIGTKPQSQQFFVAWTAALLGLVLLVSVLSNLSVGRSFMKKEVSDHWRPAGIVGAAPGSTGSTTTPSFADIPSFGQTGAYAPTTPAAPAFSNSWGVASSNFGQRVALVQRTQKVPSTAAGAGRPTLFECPVCGSMRYVRCPRCRERLSLDSGGRLVCPAGHVVPTIPSCPGCGAHMHAR